jgi:hypothetical protein
MHPGERLVFSPIEGRPPLKLPNRLKLRVSRPDDGEHHFVFHRKNIFTHRHAARVPIPITRPGPSRD